MSIEGLYHCDVLQLLDLVEQNERPQLIFMDPPFNIGEPYLDGVQDSKPRSDFLADLKTWVRRASEVLAPGGSLWVHVPDDLAGHVAVEAERLGLVRLNWVIWHYRFGVWQPNRFISSKCHGLHFGRAGGRTKLRPGRVLVPSDRATLYNDPRSPTGERMDLDVWGFEKYWGRVQGNNRERRSVHPNQLPELYLRRIVLYTTDPGELVVDPFCGSGTTATVASSLGRRYVTGDLSLSCLHSAAERIAKGAVRC